MLNRIDKFENETNYIRNEILNCEDVEDLKTNIFPLLKSQQEEWSKKINEIILKNKYTKKRFAELCNVSRVTVDKWCKGILPKNREHFLRIGIAAQFDINEFNAFLKRYGRYPALYSKSLEDCVCIYVLSQNYGEKGIEKYYYILDKIKKNIIKSDDDNLVDISTEKFNEKLLEIKDDSELENFISENVNIFSLAYHKFYAYVNMFINVNYQFAATSVNEMAIAQNWSSSLKQCVSSIRQKKWYPTRNKIISLGLHLSMDHEQINEMLELAHMEPLCAKNIFESVIIFILEDASLNNMLDSNLDGYDQDNLFRFARNILTEINIPEVASFISELAEINDE